VSIQFAGEIVGLAATGAGLHGFLADACPLTEPMPCGSFKSAARALSFRNRWPLENLDSNALRDPARAS